MATRTTIANPRVAVPDPKEREGEGATLRQSRVERNVPGTRDERADEERAQRKALSPEEAETRELERQEKRDRELAELKERRERPEVRGWKLDERPTQYEEGATSLRVVPTSEEADIRYVDEVPIPPPGPVREDPFEPIPPARTGEEGGYVPPDLDPHPVELNSGVVVVDMAQPIVVDTPPEYVPTEPPPEGGVVEPPPDIVATGATAGSPGSFTPAGAVAPADLAAMTAVVADPVTAWTSGQHVVPGDASQTSWNGTTWVAGAPVSGTQSRKRENV